MSGGDGDNRNMWIAFSADTINEVKIQTTSYSATEQGMGVNNYEVKSGTTNWHGSAYDFVRNTAFDTWGFTQPAVTVKNSSGQNVPAGKPAEHQNEYGATIGGPILNFLPLIRSGSVQLEKQGVLLWQLQRIPRSGLRYAPL